MAIAPKESPPCPENGCCPFVPEPFDGCYCVGLESKSVPDAIYYCGGHYRECDIYLLHEVKRTGEE